MTQKQLAQAAGTSQQVISQLEDADYQGHSLSMLRRIAAALDRRVEIRRVEGVYSRSGGKERRGARASRVRNCVPFARVRC